MSLAKLRTPVCAKDSPQSPESPNHSNEGLYSQNSTPISPNQSIAVSSEVVTKTQGFIARTDQ